MFHKIAELQTKGYCYRFQLNSQHLFYTTDTDARLFKVASSLCGKARPTTFPQDRIVGLAVHQDSAYVGTDNGILYQLAIEDLDVCRKAKPSNSSLIRNIIHCQDGLLLSTEKEVCIYSRQKCRSHNTGYFVRSLIKHADQVLWTSDKLGGWILADCRNFSYLHQSRFDSLGACSLNKNAFLAAGRQELRAWDNRANRYIFKIQLKEPTDIYSLVLCQNAIYYTALEKRVHLLSECDLRTLKSCQSEGTRALEQSKWLRARKEEGGLKIYSSQGTRLNVYSNQ